MRAVLFCTGDWPDLAPLNDRLPGPLLPLLDRPFVQHVVEYLISRGVKRLDIVLSHLPEKVEEALGDGKRWGCPITYHLARDPGRPYDRLRSLSVDDGAPLLLGHADRLPLLPVGVDLGKPTLFLDSAAAWTGWAVLNGGQLAGVPASADEAGLRTAVTDLIPAEVRRVEVARVLSCQTFGGILDAHRAFLAHQFADLLVTAREVEPGIWLARNVVLHPTAQLFAPVCIAQDCEIGAAVKLGPDAVVGSHCVLDAHSTVTNSVIFPGSYIGQALELADVIVDKNRLINARVGGVVTITENFILGNLEEKHVRRSLARLVALVGGWLLLLLGLPVLLGVALWLKLTRAGPVLYRKEVVRLPAAAVASAPTYHLWSFAPPERLPPLASWRGLLLRVLPAAVNIAAGQLGFVGLPPRSRTELAKLPADWQALVLAGKSGILTETALLGGRRLSEDERYAGEAVYLAVAGLRSDVQLLLRYLHRVCFGVRKVADLPPAPNPALPLADTTIRA